MNKPGQDVDHLIGGVVGGSLTCGILRKNSQASLPPSLSLLSLSLSLYLSIYLSLFPTPSSVDYSRGAASRCVRRVLIRVREKRA